MAGDTDTSQATVAELQDAVRALCEAFVVPPDDPCGRCGHGGYDHRLDDSSNVAPTDPAAQFRCVFPMVTDRLPSVRLCRCVDYVGTGT